MDATTLTHPKLAGVHPRLMRAYDRLSHALAELGCPIVVTDGVRTTGEQQALFAKGRTEPGPKVTNADGIKARSNHQAHPDGFGHAIDCTFLGPDGKPRWSDDDPWPLYGAAAKQLGLKWGGDWKS